MINVLAASALGKSLASEMSAPPMKADWEPEQGAPVITTQRRSGVFATDAIVEMIASRTGVERLFNLVGFETVKVAMTPSFLCNSATVTSDPSTGADEPIVCTDN